MGLVGCKRFSILISELTCMTYTDIKQKAESEAWTVIESWQGMLC